MPAGATYEPIATASPTGTATVTFNSIPGTYTDLRLTIFEAPIGSNMRPKVTINNTTTGTLYSQTNLFGTGAAATSSSATSANFWELNGSANATATIPDFYTVDLFSYAGSTNKTALITGSIDLNGSGRVYRIVGLFRSTSAITRIDIANEFGTNYVAGTTMTLYGIKAA